MAEGGERVEEVDCAGADGDEGDGFDVQMVEDCAGGGEGGGGAVGVWDAWC